MSPSISPPLKSNNSFDLSRYDRGPFILDKDDEQKIFQEKLQEAALKVTPCDEESKNDAIICDDVKDPNYPVDAVTNFLYRHKLFANKDYFNKLFDKPCKPKPEKKEDEDKANLLVIRSGFDLKEQELCETKETFSYPQKAKNLNGVWKYIVNTEDYKQGISVLKCLHYVQGKSCKYGGALGLNPEATTCKQLYSKQQLLSISMDGFVDYDVFWIPSACGCHLVDKDIFYF